MIITCSKDSKWKTNSGILSFVKDQDLEVGEDVPDKIAEDMLRCGYADPKQRKKIETKVIETKPKDEKQEKVKSKKRRK